MERRDSKLIQILKWIWIIVIIFISCKYIYENWNYIIYYFKNIRCWKLVISIGTIIFGKLILNYLSIISVNGLGWTPSYFEMLPISALTQLGKYIPGGIWHFVGKFGVYQSKGMDKKRSSKAILVENLWLVVSAFTIGASLLLMIDGNIVCSLVHVDMQDFVCKLLGICLLVFWLVFLYFSKKYVSINKVDIKEYILLPFILCIIWIVLGFSLWILFPEISVIDFKLVIGAFALSWAIGYISIFAPGGIGVREIILGSILMIYFPFDQIIIFATVHRLLWTISEILLGLISGFLFGFID